MPIDRETVAHAVLAELDRQGEEGRNSVYVSPVGGTLDQVIIDGWFDLLVLADAMIALIDKPE